MYCLYKEIESSFELNNLFCVEDDLKKKTVR